MEAQQAQMMRLSNKSFSLIELLVTMTILAFSLCGLVATYINLFFLSDLSRDTTLATNAIQGKLEEIKNTPFDCLFSAPCASCAGGCTKCFCSQSTFALEGIQQGAGKIEITNVIGYGNLKSVRVLACFKSRHRLIGNDLSNCQSSPVEVITHIAK